VSELQVDAGITLQEDARLVDLMRTCICAGKISVSPGVSDRRSKSFERAALDFNWQLFYYWKRRIAAERNAHRVHGATLQFRQSPGNPDPAAEVRWGDQAGGKR